MWRWACSYSRYEQWPERAVLLRDGVADTDAFFRWVQWHRAPLCARAQVCGPSVCSWQQSFGGFDEVTAELQLLKEAFVHSCVAFGRSLGWQGVESRWHADNVQVWVGVMGTGAYHPRHVHKGSVVRRPWSRAIACCARVASPIDPSIVVGLQLSGAYYVNAPPGSGDIVFHDPRGALPPFEHTLRYPAQVGHMVVFPSWLVHEVLPNALAGEWASARAKRVAVSFNLRGQWEDTSDVSVAFPA